MFKKLHKQQQGFTLIEILVVVGILTILLAITLIALNPASHFASARNTQRSSDVTAILDAVYQYQAANKGSLPASVSGLTAGTVYTLTNDSGVTNRTNVCSDLVPAYIADLPKDPGAGTQTPTSGAVCSATTYNTGYTITRSATGNRFTVAAPSAEASATISVTR